MEKRSVKVVAVGDGAVGKSCLVRSLMKDSSDLYYIPTVFDNHVIEKTINDVPFTVAWFDTAGQEDYDRLRPLSYPTTDLFVLCFSVDNKASLENVSAKWHTETWHHCPGVPVILVGTKSDRRKKSPVLVTRDEALKMAKKIDAFCYVECSSDTMEGMDELLEKIYDCINKERKRELKTLKTTKCCVMM